MQKTKATQDLDQPQQDIQPTVAQQCHEESAEVVGKSLDVNENDVRDQNRSGTEPVKGGQQCHANKKDEVLDSCV